MVQVVDEESWIAAAKDGGNMADLERAFYWRTAKEWPCPGFSDERDNGWRSFWHQTTGLGDAYSRHEQEIAEATPIPPHIREYIAIMYVDWKLNGDDDSA